MALAPSPDSAQTSELELVPLRLPLDLRLSPEQYSCGEGFAYELVCQANPDAVLELAADGHLIAMTPTGWGNQQSQRRDPLPTAALCQKPWRLEDV